MCGIAGWVDFERDLRSRQSAVRVMTDTLAARGPDDEGIWADRHAVLGHRRLAVIDPVGGQQPMAAGDDTDPRAVITYCGEVYNHRELRAELAARGHRFRTRCDTEVLLRAFLEWGADCATRMDGMFAFAVWDPGARELTLVRDRLGVKPLFYYPTGTGVLFGSEPKAVLAHPRAESAVDADGMRELLVHGRTPGRAPFRGMREVRPGHVLRVTREATTERRYWSLTANPHTDDTATTVATARELLQDAVGGQLVADVPLGLLLSGGIDSSTLTGLAHRWYGHEGGSTSRTRTFSMGLTGYTENFQPHPSMRGTPDAPYVTTVSEHLGTDHTEILLDASALADPQVHRAVLLAQDVPTPLGDMDTSLYLLFQGMKQHVTVALSGEAADEVFGGYPWAYDRTLADAGTYPWVAFAQRQSASSAGFGCGLLDQGLLGELDVLGYGVDGYRAALAEVPELEAESADRRRARQVEYLVLTRWLPPLLDRKDRLGMAAGVELRVPYCDHRLVQYLYDVPLEVKRLGGREKGLLRAAAADLLPSSVLNRPKSSYPATQDPEYGRLVQERFRSLIAASDAPVAPLLDRQAARDAAAAPAPTGAFAWVQRSNMEMALQLNTWLEAHDVQLKL
ncbi:asparagine synthase (glutamine-hydrolyzing) [Wenjunlia tyrosinilytica]|uniref:asparagine synthase (glutamine-hydrolyzing) n=1 Tax=Wenjunlia tyrosinilytica TaxID=1544741 RepID=A0A918E1U8_9ACTN|nr:asparagine synthase (glutamine-hydrolyzing) [Wenjunlia tyrosinilytica]GGO97298.1 asparagine synthetase B [Wenjunlia tyrosinilytica]